MKHITALDGLRGLAVLMVVLTHYRDADTAPAYLAVVQFGWVGVDLFFVLSGFLITGILLDSRQRADYFRVFYARRTLRIFPLYYGALFLFLVVLPQCAPGIDTVDHWPYWLFLANVAAATPDTLPLDIFWSLAVEEHFYLVWPYVVRHSKKILPICVGGIAWALCLRAVLAANNAPWRMSHFLTPCRIDALLVGCAIAALWHGGKRTQLIRVARWALPASAVGVAATVIPFKIESWPVQTVGLTLLAAFFGSLLVVALSAGSVFSLAPLRFLGKYSYAMYVFHTPVRNVLRDFMLGHGPWQALSRVVMGFALTVAISLVSWHLWEKWWLALKPTHDYARQHANRRHAVDAALLTIERPHH